MPPFSDMGAGLTARQSLLALLDLTPSGGLYIMLHFRLRNCLWPLSIHRNHVGLSESCGTTVATEGEGERGS